MPYFACFTRVPGGKPAGPDTGASRRGDGAGLAETGAGGDCSRAAGVWAEGLGPPSRLAKNCLIESALLYVAPE